MTRKPLNPSQWKIFLVIFAVLFLSSSLLAWVGSASASPFQPLKPLTTPIPERPGPPPTVYPPAQADIGAQVYWGMCQDCHGDQGQGLTAEWRAVFAPDLQDCWASGCHGEDAPPGSFPIPETGAPALAVPGALPQFSTAFELGTYIQDSMPLAPPGSLTEDQAWELTAYLLAWQQAGDPAITLSGTNSGAIPVHSQVKMPENSLPGTLLLSLVLIIGAAAYSASSKSFQGKKGRGNFFHHLHPATIPADQSRFGYTLGAGGLAVFLCLVLLITGLLETFYYQPHPRGAAESIQMLSVLVPYGDLVRNLHFWAAQLLVIVLMVHLLRIILTGAYAPPRRLNYLIGLFLLVIALLLDFTGYVLRWDEGIRWALVVGTNLLKTVPGIGENLYQFVIGGNEPGPPTLIRFYSWHIYGLSVIFAGFTAWHIFRVRRDGGISAPPPARREAQTRIPRRTLIRKEVLAMLLGGAVLLVLAGLFPAPIDRPLSPNGNLAGDQGAPWFFLWIQETLKLGDPFLWGIAVPLLAVIILGLLPYIVPHPDPSQLGRWLPKGSRAAQIIGAAVIALLFVLTLVGWLS